VPPAVAREAAVGVVKEVQGQADLLEVVLARGAVGRFANFLHGGQQQENQRRHDGDDHEEFDQGEGRATPVWGCTHRWLTVSAGARGEGNCQGEKDPHRGACKSNPREQPHRCDYCIRKVAKWSGRVRRPPWGEWVLWPPPGTRTSLAIAPARR